VAKWVSESRLYLYATSGFFLLLPDMKSSIKPWVLACSVRSVFDTSIDRYNVYKVETIGDAYMVASGLPTVYDRHAEEISLLALEILDSVKQHVIQHLPRQEILLRIGLHSGATTHTTIIL